MNSPIVIALIVLAFLLIGVIVWMLRNSQQLKLAELSSREKLLARESELGNAIQSQHLAEKQNASLASELQSLREQKARLETSLELERKQHGEKLALLDESKEQLGIAFKNIAKSSKTRARSW